MRYRGRTLDYRIYANHIAHVGNSFELCPHKFIAYVRDMGSSFLEFPQKTIVLVPAHSLIAHGKFRRVRSEPAYRLFNFFLDYTIGTEDLWVDAIKRKTGLDNPVMARYDLLLDCIDDQAAVNFVPIQTTSNPKILEICPIISSNSFRVLLEERSRDYSYVLPHTHKDLSDAVNNLRSPRRQRDISDAPLVFLSSFSGEAINFFAHTRVRTEKPFQLLNYVKQLGQE